MKLYRKTAEQPMEPWVPGYDMTGVSVSACDSDAGSPRAGDMIAVNPKDPTDRWLIAEASFLANYADAPGLTREEWDTLLGALYCGSEHPVWAIVARIRAHLEATK